MAKRYRDTLNPELDRQEWTAEEDSVLLAAYNQVGPLWTVICAKVGPGRSGMHVRNRFRALTKASSPGVARRDSDGSRERSSAAGPSRTKRSTASTSAAGRSRSPHTRPEPSRATSVPSTTGGDSVSSPFDFDKYYAALASPAPYPIPFDPTCGTSTSPFTDVELAFLRNYPPPSDATDNATEWARMQGLSPPIWPLTEQPVVSQAPSVSSRALASLCCRG